jgi:hypothetical protein
MDNSRWLDFALVEGRWWVVIQKSLAGEQINPD